MESKSGRMEQSIQETGETIWQREKAHSIMQMAMFTQVNSTRIEPMVLEHMFMLMVKNMKDSGSKICRMVLEKKSSKMAPNTKACSRMERNGVKEPTSGPIIQFILEIGLTIISKAKVNINGQMVGSIRESGKRTSFMAKDYTPGQTVENMKENILTTKSTDMEPIIGQTAKFMKVNGKMESNMEKLNSPILKERAK